MTAQSEQGAIPPSAANQMETNESQNQGSTNPGIGGIPANDDFCPTDLADPGRLAGNLEVILAYDVETLRAVFPGADKAVPGVQYVADWSDASKRQMGIACCGVENVATGESLIFTERIMTVPTDGQFRDLYKLLVVEADLLVSFGGGDGTESGFDNEVLAGAGIEVDRTKCFDLRLAIKRATGGSLPKGLTLGKLAEANADLDFPSLGRGKTGDGALAPQLWAEGRYQEVVDYCLDGDVKMTADLCRKLIRDGYLILPGGDRVTIDWPGKGAGSLPVPASDLEVSSGKEVVPSPTGEQQPDSDLGSVDHCDGTGNRGGDNDASGDGSKLAELPGERGEKDVGPVTVAGKGESKEPDRLTAKIRDRQSVPALDSGIKPVQASKLHPVSVQAKSGVQKPVQTSCLPIENKQDAATCPPLEIWRQSEGEPPMPRNFSCVPHLRNDLVTVRTVNGQITVMADVVTGWQIQWSTVCPECKKRYRPVAGFVSARTSRRLLEVERNEQEREVARIIRRRFNASRVSRRHPKCTA